MFKTLRTVIYKTADLEAAKQWYAGITGRQPYFDQPFYVGFDINGCELGLDPDMKDVAPANQAVAYWAVDSVEDTLKTMIEKRATLIEPRTNVGGSTYVAVLQDPFGNRLGIIEGA